MKTEKLSFFQRLVISATLIIITYGLISYIEHLGQQQ
jgi:hypothetical protein